MMQPDLQPPTARTPGEKQFDNLAYVRIGYLANVAISIAAMWLADRTHAGKNFIYHTAKKLSRLTGVEAETLRPQIRYTSLLTGGFSVLLPIKLLEDRKIDIVKAYDEALLSQHPQQETPEALAARESRYAALEREPRQSWASILGSRFLAMVPFYGFTNIAMREGQWLARNTGGKIFAERLITKAARGIDASLHAGNPQALAEIAEKNRLYPNYTVNSLVRGDMERPITALADYTITEAITSGIVASFLYLFTRITAPFLGKKPDTQTAPFSPVAPLELLQETSPAAHSRPQHAQAPDVNVSGVQRMNKIHIGGKSESAGLHASVQPQSSRQH